MHKQNKLWKVNAECNGMNHKYIEDIQSVCNKHKNVKKKDELPKYREELNELLSLEKEHGY